MKIWVDRVGCVSRGHVLDVAIKPFSQALRDLDPYLYVKWNAKKLQGHGVWEIRRSPIQKQVSELIEFNGITYARVEAVESDLINHVLDCAFLNYDAIRKLKSMDRLLSNDPVGDIERRERDHREKMEAKVDEDFKDKVKEHRSMARDLRELVRSGYSLDRFVSDIPKLGSKE